MKKTKKQNAILIWMYICIWKKWKIIDTRLQTVPSIELIRSLIGNFKSKNMHKFITLTRFITNCDYNFKLWYWNYHLTENWIPMQFEYDTKKVNSIEHHWSDVIFKHHLFIFAFGLFVCLGSVSVFNTHARRHSLMHLHFNECNAE